MVALVLSKHGVPIRLTDERWSHITEEHCELAGLRSEVLDAVVQPERIVLGGDGEHLAIREVEEGKHLVVIYREGTETGLSSPHFSPEGCGRW